MALVPPLLLIAALAAAVVSPLTSTPASARDFTAGGVKVSDPWTRVTPPAAKVAGGFMKLTNTGTVADKLLGGSSPVTGRIEVHEMSLDGGIMKMRELSQGLEIKPGETVELKPGSFHIMFLELKAPIKPGATVKGTLIFEKAGPVEIEYRVAPLGAKGPNAASTTGHHHHHGK